MIFKTNQWNNKLDSLSNIATHDRNVDALYIFKLIKCTNLCLFLGVQTFIKVIIIFTIN